MPDTVQTEGKATGQSLDRVDGRAKVTGTAAYSGDRALPGTVHAMLVQSTVARGRLTKLDTSAAEGAPGVLYVMTHRNRPPLQSPPEKFTQDFPAERRAPLADDAIHYAGQHIALVVAGTLEQAHYAAGLVRAEYEAEQPVLTPLQALDASYAPDHFATNTEEKLQSSRGDVAHGREATRASHEYRTPVLTHNPMEMAATVAQWQGNELTLFDSTRWLYGERMVMAHMLGIAEEQVHVVCEFVGGAFGSKGFLWQHVALVALAARVVEKPVKLMLTRQQMFTSIGHRPKTYQTVALAAETTGKLSAVEHHALNETSPVAHFVEPAAMMARHLYSCENAAISHRVAPVNIATPCFMRAPGESPGLFALESEMDALAYALSIDPLELRLRNYAEIDEQEQRPWSSKQLRACYEQGARRFGWKARNPQPGSMRRGHLRVGWGMATAAYPGRRSPATVRAVAGRDGRVVFSTATHAIGTGTATVMVQIAADALGVPAERIEFRLGDTAFPKAPVAGASQTTASVGPAVNAAAEALRAKLIGTAVGDTASPLHGREPSEIKLERGHLNAGSAASEDYTAVLGRMQMPQLEAEGEAKLDDEQKKKFTFQSFGVHFAEVLVDTQLCQCHVSRWVGVFDPGRVMNPKTARSQVLGGIVFGLGMALFEETIYDPRTGGVVNPDLSEYLLPVNPDVPEIDVSFIDIPDERFNPLGCRGVGELPITGVPAAIANAVYHATGKRITDLPITPEKLLG